MKRNVFTMVGVITVITVSGLGALTSYATSLGVTESNQETQAKPAVYTANIIKSMGSWEYIDNTWKFKLKDGRFLAYSWIQSTSNESDYYFLSSDGIMLTNTTTPDGYVVNAAGVWRATASSEEVQKQVEDAKAAQVETEQSKEVETLQNKYREKAQEILNDPEYQKSLESAAQDWAQGRNQD